MDNDIKNYFKNVLNSTKAKYLNKFNFIEKNNQNIH